MTKFEIGDIVYPEYYPEDDTRCTVVAVDAPCPCGCGGKVLIVETDDGRTLFEYADCFLSEQEWMNS